jgi:hypothetical protein
MYCVVAAVAQEDALLRWKTFEAELAATAAQVNYGASPLLVTRAATALAAQKVHHDQTVDLLLHHQRPAKPSTAATAAAAAAVAVTEPTPIVHPHPLHHVMPPSESGPTTMTPPPPPPVIVSSSSVWRQAAGREPKRPAPCSITRKATVFSGKPTASTVSIASSVRSGVHCTTGDKPPLELRDFQADDSGEDTAGDGAVS